MSALTAVAALLVGFSIGVLLGAWGARGTTGLAETKKILGLDKNSASRAFLWFAVGVGFAVWLAIGVLMFLELIEWTEWEGWLTWGRDALIVAGGTFVGNEIGTAVGKHA